MADPGRLEELKRKFDENPRRYFAPLANEYRKVGDAERAIELCRTYLPQQPTHMSGYIVYGQALYDAGRTDEASAVFQQALTLDPENIIALRYLGDIAREKDDRPTAIRWYGKVLELDPRNDEVTNLIADLASPVQPRRYEGPERPVPPTIRPEPEDQGDVLALEELIALPDVPQAEIILPIDSPSVTTIQTADESVTIIRWPTEEEDETGTVMPIQPVAGASVESMMDFGLDEPMVAEQALESARPSGEESPIAFGGAPMAGEAYDTDSYGAEDFTGEPIAGGDFLPASEDEEERSPLADESEGPTGQAVGAAPAGEPATPEAESGPAQASVSPFMTETMAELYVAQGMHGEAIAIYRELVDRREDPRLRARLEELEAAQAPAALAPEAPSEATAAGGAEAQAAATGEPATQGESVRDFFTRIGARRADAAPHISADGETGLTRLFGGAALDAGDVSAAQSLAGAFTSAAPDDSTPRA